MLSADLLITGWMVVSKTAIVFGVSRAKHMPMLVMQLPKSMERSLATMKNLTTSPTLILKNMKERRWTENQEGAPMEDMAITLLMIITTKTIPLPTITITESARSFP